MRELVTAAVERRLMSDVPLGAFLSGGIDSTIIVGVMSQLMREPVRTFSIGFEGDAAFDETAIARDDGRTLRHARTPSSASSRRPIDLLDTLVYHHDGPFADSSAIPTYLVSKLTREHVTVALTGDGGDEVFARLPALRRGAGGGARARRWAASLAAAALSPLPSPRNERHLAGAGEAVRPIHAPAAARPADRRGPVSSTTMSSELLDPGLLARVGAVDRATAHLAGSPASTAHRRSTACWPPTFTATCMTICWSKPIA